MESLNATLQTPVPTADPLVGAQAVPPPPAMIKSYKTVFDLDSKDDVTVVKVGPKPNPISSINEFVAACKNDAALILRLCQSALESYAQEQLAADPNVPYMVETEDDAGNVAYEPFAGTLLTEEKSKQLNANVVNMAKMLFGFDRTMDTDKAKNRELKKAAKTKALEMILSNPAVIEALKK